MVARIIFRRTHLVLSLVAGLWLAASGIAGSLLVFGDALDPLIHRALYTTRDAARRVAIDDVIVAAEGATGGVATRVRLSGDGTPVHEVWIDCDDCVRVWVDPSTATVNGVRSAHGTTRLFLHELHRRMMLRGVGDIGALLGGIVLVFLAITGIVLGWRGGLRLRKVNNYEFHRVIGLIVSPMFLIAGATGIYFIQAGLKAAPPSTAKAIRIVRTIEPLMDRARAEFPDAEMTWLSLAGPQVMVRFRQDAEKHPNGRTFVRFAAASGELTARTDALATDASTRFFDNLYPLHIGATGGIVHKVVLVVVGLTPAFFLVTGLILCVRRWLRSWRRREMAAHAVFMREASHALSTPEASQRIAGASPKATTGIRGD